MKLFSYLITACLLSITLLFPAVSDKNNIDLKNIQSGEILFYDIEENSVTGIEAVFMLHTTPEKLWDIITDYKHYKDNFESIKEIKIIHEDKKGAILELWVDSALKTFHYFVSRDYVNPLHKLTWEKTSGDFQTNRGSWEIINTNDLNSCIVKYRTFVEVDGIIGKTFKGMTKPESIKRISRMVTKLKSILNK